MSWNISDDAFVSEQQVFRSLLLWADPDIVLLDEVAPSASDEELRKSLDALRSDEEDTWTVNVGVSGGRQRCVIASRTPQEKLPEFESKVPYPDADRRYLLEHMSNKDRAYPAYSMDGGRRLLTVTADLQCCGNEQNSCKSTDAGPRRSSGMGSKATHWREPVDTALWWSSTDGTSKTGWQLAA